MSAEYDPLKLPEYDQFLESISPLALEVSVSEIHGTLCGYLSAGADKQGESYIRALLKHKKDAATRNALLSLFSVFTISQQQLSNSLNFDFQLLLPSDDYSLRDRAQAFSQWCEGFKQGLTFAGVVGADYQEEDAQEALQHLHEFSQLDYESLEVSEEDEQALIEVIEYTRMAVLRLHTDLLTNQKKQSDSSTTH